MKLVKDPKSVVPEGMVRVKMLKHVGQYSPNDIVDADPETATTLCQISHVHDGTKPVPTAKAMRIADFLKATEDAAQNIDQLTVGEMTEMGIKNVVPTPADPAFEKSMKIAREAAEGAQEERSEMTKAQKAAAAKRAQRASAQAKKSEAHTEATT